MSAMQTKLSPELVELQEKGFSISICDGYYMMENIPYLNSNKELNGGVLILPITSNPSHVVHFQGEFPCDDKGNSLEFLRHQTTGRALTAGVLSNFAFSNQPQGGLRGHAQIFIHYYNVISAYAQALFPGAKATSVKADWKLGESQLKYCDTNTSKSYISSVSNKLRGQKVAIIGLGGTGSYILDHVTKTPVDEIHMFDDDVFDQHNAFRCPGAHDESVFDKNIGKVEYLYQIYSKMHGGLIPNQVKIDQSNLSFLDDIDYVFLCIDNPVPKSFILSYLEKHEIPFVDVGITVDIVEDRLHGLVRNTSSSKANPSSYKKRISTETGVDDAYASNIQISELNSLNADLAVLRWKKFSGFYDDQLGEHNTTFVINTGQVIHEDYPA